MQRGHRVAGHVAAHAGSCPCGARKKTACEYKHRPQGLPLIGATTTAHRGGARGGAACGNNAYRRGQGDHQRRTAPHVCVAATMVVG
ncbi:hypothetical protein B296_00034236 [Ensete ventricosum]|uniref:Uncharacterized protein n=1 Tax=Ensete ventricosum TaxID=4639 RepID=A0A426Z4Y3_ENSVE|nr:hypothetical protein B296_00034236 [Ensete ventricosum]